MTRKTSNTMTDALLLVGGGVVGAGMALLLAPQPGTKSRKEITRFSKEVGRKGETALHNITASVTGMADTVGEKAAGMLRKW